MLSTQFNRALRRPRDDGSLSVLIIGYAGIAVLLLVVGIDASKLFLAQRALASAADDAAIEATRGVAVQRIYDDGGVTCGQPLPLNATDAQRDADASVNDYRTDLRHVFTSVGRPAVGTQQATVTVQLSGIVTVPFGRAIGWLLPAHADGEFRVTETASANSPVAGAVC